MASGVQSFWSTVEQTKTVYSPDSPVVVQGKTLSDRAQTMQMQMFQACTATDRFVMMLRPNPPMKILDLGAGMGVNTLPLAIAGAHVTAIDNSRELLSAFARACAAHNCPAERLRLRRGDITTMESYGGSFDLVVAIDILPYIPPTTLRSTMEKIHKCLEDRGLLIGTIFTTNDPPVMRQLSEQLGAHYYENGRKFATQLLQHSGFKVINLEARQEGGFRFRAEKISDTSLAE